MLCFDEDADDESEFFDMDDPNEEANMHMRTSLRALRYLVNFFGKINVEFQGTSRREIEETFRTAKRIFANSKLFREFMDSKFAMSYQHFPNIIKHLAPRVPKSKRRQ